ncbi:VWA domain-containing protein [Lutimonas sp.]|uniref:VWA domain-containing protein n=1 Tax=Lutimonas sp. TaxID=1872403 RepID=UPI003D9BDBF6
MPDNFEIAYPWVFLLVLLPLFIYWLAPPFRIKSASLQVPNLQRATSITGVKPRNAAMINKKNRFVSFLMFIIWVLLLMALSSPRLVGEPELKIKTSRNFLIVADISFSMANSDWLIDGKRATRWEAVKNVMHDFIEKRTGDRMGLIFFGSSAYIQAPFTSDLKTVEQLLDEADVGMAGQMTNIGKAIVKGIHMFDQDTIKTKVMLVLTDGVDSGTEILPLDAADLAKKDSVHIYTIGIGDPENGGSDLDEETLKTISEVTDARYFRAIDSDQLGEIYDELDSLEPIEYEEETFKPTTLLYYYPLGMAIALVLLLSLIRGIYSLFNYRNNG